MPNEAVGWQTDRPWHLPMLQGRRCHGCGQVLSNTECCREAAGKLWAVRFARLRYMAGRKILCHNALSVRRVPNAGIITSTVASGTA